jgi:hypothetical protein
MGGLTLTPSIEDINALIEMGRTLGHYNAEVILTECPVILGSDQMAQSVLKD